MFARFGVLAWRSRLVHAVQAPLSETFRDALGFTSDDVSAGDFETMATMLRVCPRLEPVTKSAVPFIGAYSLALRWLLNHVAGASSGVRERAETELAVCARYLALQLDQRLQQNRACLADYLRV